MAGSVGQSGSADGVGNGTRFFQASGVAADSAGFVYVADALNYWITKGTPLLQFDASWRMCLTNGSFHVRLIGPSNSTVVLEACANFEGWSPIQTNSLPGSGLDLSVSVNPNVYQFFRAVLAP